MRQQEKIKVLEDLIAIESVNDHELKVAEYLAKFLERFGIKAKIDRFDGQRANLIAEIGEKQTDQVFCLTGHQDTVAVGDQVKWKTDPFKATIIGERIYGRGSADMKSGLAAEIIALAELAESGWNPPGTLRLLATAGEEFGTPGAYRLAKQGLVDDVNAMVVGEPTSGQVVYAHAGTINYQIQSFGKSVHSSRPEAGINAISGLNAYLTVEKHLFDQAPRDPDLGAFKHSITMISGGSQINIIPDQAVLFGNLRPTPAFPNQKVIQLIKDQVSAINGQSRFQLQFKLLHNFYPVKTAADDLFVQTAAAISAEHFADQVIGLTTINGATDASVFVERNPRIKAIVLGPDAWKSAHQNNEFTTLPSFLAMIKIYRDLVKAYFSV
ncbi:ArgE/DapE family deacylase [Liquorilactobacillus sicerae]|uniref:ArgE/DapE family deacylase n=1 Tax=Liquorilactobacillus sicerae TaxID=1416943 RepID=UPI00247FBB0C|nr:ArgE/DapE family deacylase [Liquorilactobacillus sicerae]